MLRELAPDLWVTEQPFRYLGIEVGARTTVIKLSNGSLLVHSPASLDTALREDLDRKGKVGFIVAPNRFHHLFVGDYQLAYPHAESYCAPGLQTKRADLKFNAVLSDEVRPEWSGQLDQLVFSAFPPLNEVVILHRASRTVIFTDLLFNVTHTDSTLSRLAFKLDGGYKKPAVARTFKLLIRFKRAQARALIDRILAWDFDRVVLAHGDVIETGGKRAVAEAWSFV
jgi:hypothetical protein